MRSLGLHRPEAAPVAQPTSLPHPEVPLRSGGLEGRKTHMQVMSSDPREIGLERGKAFEIVRRGEKVDRSAAPPACPRAEGW